MVPLVSGSELILPVSIRDFTEGFHNGQFELNKGRFLTELCKTTLVETQIKYIELEIGLLRQRKMMNLTQKCGILLNCCVLKKIIKKVAQDYMLLYYSSNI